MTRKSRAWLAYVSMILVVTWFDWLLAIEVTVLSWFTVLAIRQLIIAWNDSKNIAVKLIYLFITSLLILVFGVLFALPMITLPRIFVRNFSQSVASQQLSEIVIAMHNYHKDLGQLPPVANLSKEGKPLLSWRVHLLPYLGEERLYKQFHLDEPWDSPHNLALLPQMPGMYQLPKYARQFPPGYTCYQLFVGEGAFMEIGKKRTLGMLTIADGTDTLLGAIAEDAVPWTKPADILFSADQTLGVGKVYEVDQYGRYYLVTVSGMSISLRSRENVHRLKPYITWNGNEKVNIQDIEGW